MSGFYLTLGWLAGGLVCRIGDRAAVLPFWGSKQDLFALWQIKTLSLPLKVTMNTTLAD